MPEVKISADINKAIGQITKQLGVTAKEILPHYTKQIKVEGITNAIGGGLLIILPWLIWLFNAPADWDKAILGFILVLKVGFCFLCSLYGIVGIINNINKIIVPQAHAISYLIDQITDAVE